MKTIQIELKFVNYLIIQWAQYLLIKCLYLLKSALHCTQSLTLLMPFLPQEEVARRSKATLLRRMPLTGRMKAMRKAVLFFHKSVGGSFLC